MELVDHRAGHVADPLGRPLDLGDARQKGEHAALGLAQRRADRGRHRFLDPGIGGAAQMAQLQRPAAPFALHHGRIAHQAREARPVERRRHRDQPQVRPQRRLGVERQCQPEIAVEAAFVHFVEQHGGDARQLGIGLDAIDENPFRHHRHARCRRTPAVHPGGIAEGLADALPRQRRHPLARRACGQPARGEQQHLAAAPVLAQQRRGHRRRLARARRGDQHGVAARAQRGEQGGQDGLDRQCLTHHAQPIPRSRVWRKRSLRSEDMARTLAQFSITPDSDGDYTLHLEDDDGETLEFTASFEQLDLIVEAIEEVIDDEGEDALAGDDDDDDAEPEDD
jgi:hypothetical protein